MYQREMDCILSKVRLGSMGACLPRRCVRACIHTHVHTRTPHTHVRAHTEICTLAHTNTLIHPHTCHINHALTCTLPFNASGKVNLENAVTRWKWGVGRLIAESAKTPIVIPLWHVGMEDILPTRSPLIPSTVQGESSKAYAGKC